MTHTTRCPNCRRVVRVLNGRIVRHGRHGFGSKLRSCDGSGEEAEGTMTPQDESGAGQR